MNGYIHPNNFKNKNKSWGFCPKPHSPEAAGAGGKPYPPGPYGECGRFQGVKGKMHDFVALDPSISVGVAKLTEADGRLETRQGLRSNRVAAWPLQVGGDPTLVVVRVQEASHPCHVANGWAAPTVLAKTLGGRAVGENVP